MTAEKKHRPRINRVVRGNIRKMLKIRKSQEIQEGLPFRLSNWIIKGAGSIPFIAFQGLFIATWVVTNGYLIEAPFDPFPFPLLGLIITIQAIFLAVFILLNQNRINEAEKKREELNIQLGILTEYEVTKILRLLDAIADHFGVRGPDHDLQELKKETSAEQVLEVIEKEMDRIDQASDQADALPSL